MKALLMLSLLVSTSLATGVVHAESETGEIKFTVAMLADVPILRDTCSIPAETIGEASAMLEGILKAHPEFAYIVDEVQAERLVRPLTEKQKITYCPVLIRFLDKVLN